MHSYTAFKQQYVDTESVIWGHSLRDTLSEHTVYKTSRTVRCRFHWTRCTSDRRPGWPPVHRSWAPLGGEHRKVCPVLLALPGERATGEVGVCHRPGSGCSRPRTGMRSLRDALGTPRARLGGGPWTGRGWAERLKCCGSKGVSKPFLARERPVTKQNFRVTRPSSVRGCAGLRVLVTVHRIPAARNPGGAGTARLTGCLWFA